MAKALPAASVADALRHCVGACESMRIPLCLDTIMENQIQNREHTNNPWEDALDTHNNAVGFAAGQGTQSCENACLGEFSAGNLHSTDSETNPLSNP